jgi:transcriptional regulator with XRE-family HTH domain
LEADRLLIERARQRLSIQELAERSGVNAHTISDIERGVRNPRATTLAKLAGALGLDPEELLGKARAPSTSGLRSNGGDGSSTDEVVGWDVVVQRMLQTGHIAQEVVQDWQREWARSLEDGRPLPRHRILEMKSFHNELSRLYVDDFKKLLEASSLGTIGIIDRSGARQYLSPEPSRWPRELKERLYEAGEQLTALPEHINKIEREASEQHRGAVERALYEEFNVETNREELNKALAEVGS